MQTKDKEQYPLPDLISFLQRPDSMAGQKVVFQGRVLQLETLCEVSLIIIEMDTPWGGMPDEIAVESTEPQPSLSPGQKVKVWGRCLGTHIHASQSCGVTARTHVCADLLEV
jgi:hypothetical protein